MELVRRLRRDGDTPPLGRQTIGNALVVHQPDGITGEARELAMRVAPDTEHDLVVVDLPAGAPITLWESVARALPRRRRGVRLVIGGRRTREATALAGQWLAERLGRPVLAPDGPVIPGPNGDLFVHPGRGTGWVRFQAGRSPTWEGKRFPRPSWDIGLTAEPTSTSSRGVAEPIPGGLWVRPVGVDRELERHRANLGVVPAQPEVFTVLLGSPGCPPVSLDDAARLWQRMPESVRTRTRFVHYGPISVPAGGDAGQALADLLGREVAFYTGVPLGTPSSPALRSVLPDGGLGWAVFARELGYQPRQHRGAPAPLPRLLGHRVPIEGLAEVAPAVYWYAPDAVVEVVQSGLLVRAPQEGRATAALRAAVLDRAVHNLTFDPESEYSAGRMRTLAQDLMARLDAPTRKATRLLSGAALLAERTRTKAANPARAALEQPTVAAPVPVPSGDKTAEAPAPAVELSSLAAEVPVTEWLTLPAKSPSVTAVAAPSEIPAAPVEVPAMTVPNDVPVVPAEASVPEEPEAEPEPAAESPAAARQGRLQPTPPPEAVALLPEKGVAKEREWLRKSLGAEYGLMANAVARVLSEHPGFQGQLSSSSEEVLTDAVAVALYLSDKGTAIDAALRAGTNGAHVPIARCVVAGLGRLPSHRGPSTITTTLTDAEWALYRERKVVTEWGFLNVLAHPRATTAGDTDVLVWSVTGRRTKLLEPRERGVEGRVIFVPGTSFKVLDLTQPSEAGRGLLLLRELTASELDEDGRVAAEKDTLDELALASLRREIEVWAETEARQAVDHRVLDRFDTLPGLV